MDVTGARTAKRTGEREALVESRLTEHDKTLTSISSMLVSINNKFEIGGEPRFITTTAHEILSATCRANIASEVEHIRMDNAGMKSDFREFSTELKGEIKKITKSLYDIALVQAQSRGRRDTDHLEV